MLLSKPQPGTNEHKHTGIMPVSLAALPEVFQHKDPVSCLGVVLQAAGLLR